METKIKEDKFMVEVGEKVLFLLTPDPHFSWGGEKKDKKTTTKVFFSDVT